VNNDLKDSFLLGLAHFKTILEIYEKDACVSRLPTFMRSRDDKACEVYADESWYKLPIVFLINRTYNLITEQIFGFGEWLYG